MLLGQNLMSETTLDAQRTAALGRVSAALATLELAAIRHRRHLRQALHVGDEELSALLYLAGRGPVEQRTLGALSGLSRSGAGAMMQRLEDQGHVRRWTDAQDRRLRLAELTPAGRAALDQASAGWHAAIATALSPLPVDAIDGFAATLTDIAGTAEPTLTHADPAPEGTDPIWRRWA